jgi:hypothetical protein
MGQKKMYGEYRQALVEPTWTVKVMTLIYCAIQINDRKCWNSTQDQVLTYNLGRIPSILKSSLIRSTWSSSACRSGPELLLQANWPINATPTPRRPPLSSAHDFWVCSGCISTSDDDPNPAQELSCFFLVCAVIPQPSILGESPLSAWPRAREATACAVTCSSWSPDTPAATSASNLVRYRAYMHDG